MSRAVQEEDIALKEDMAARIRAALDEDIGDGDVTTLSIVPADARGKGRLIAKAAGVVAGLAVAQTAFQLVDESVRFEPLVAEGAQVKPGDLLAQVSGPTRALLTGERTALNFLQRMSGIASLTHRFVDAVAGTGTVILDTRKTTPGLRAFDKWAVRLGGGQNHRFGLFDMALIKENHIVAAGGISAAVDRVRSADRRGRPIEVEVTNLDELKETLALGVDRIMLDNMGLAKMREAVAITAGSTPLEASGGASLETAAAIAATGVDYISVGKPTHSFESLDISFLLE
ncbi:MAG: carboxylating nicotinate-nucleotide diphosphorylase [Caldilineaceae bacterium]